MIGGEAAERSDSGRSFDATGTGLHAAERPEPCGWLSKESRVHWMRPQLVAEVKFLAWTGDNLLRQVVYEGLREDKPAREVRREVPHP